MIKFTVFGAPRTKKNHNVLARAGGRHVVLPSKAWTKWAKRAQPKLKPRKFPLCEVREIRFTQSVADELLGTASGRVWQFPSKRTVEWEVWIDLKRRPTRVIRVLTDDPSRTVVLRHYDKQHKRTYKGKARLKSWNLDDSTYHGERAFIRAEFISTGPGEVIYGGKPVSPRGVIRFA